MSRKFHAEVKSISEVIAAHAPRLVERSSTFQFSYSSQFPWSVVGSLRWLGIKAEERDTKSGMLGARLATPEVSYA